MAANETGVCEFNVHEAMKADDDAWAAMLHIGYQPGDDERGDLEMRNCRVPGCDSTLARRCLLTAEQREDIREQVRQRNAEFRKMVMAALNAQQVAA